MWLSFSKGIDFHRGINLWGTFTHFATADNIDDWDFELQMKRFLETLDLMQDAGFDPGVVHAANSAATILHPETHMDMVRCGIAVYGLHPADTTRHRIELEPAMAVRARASYVKRPAIGEGVSYGLTYRVPKSVQIATLPLGYADGLGRALSNRVHFLFQGIRCKQVGRICMDQCMMEVESNPVRLNPVPDIYQGDLVTIVGREGDQEVSLDDHAALLGTINYEVACGFALRLPRVYV